MRRSNSAKCLCAHNRETSRRSAQAGCTKSRLGKVCNRGRRQWKKSGSGTLNTYARKEVSVDRILNDRGFQTFFPHTSNWIAISNGKSKLVLRPYFPQYLFVGFRDSQPKRFDLVNTTPGVRGLVHAPRSEEH